MEALWLPSWMQVRIHVCYMTQRLTIKGKTKPEFLYDNADDCVNFSIGFSLQRDFPLGNQMVPLISQFSENKPQQSDSNVYGAQLRVCVCACAHTLGHDMRSICHCHCQSVAIRRLKITALRYLSDQPLRTEWVLTIFECRPTSFLDTL